MGQLLRGGEEREKRGRKRDYGREGKGRKGKELRKVEFPAVQ